MISFALKHLKPILLSLTLASLIIFYQKNNAPQARSSASPLLLSTFTVLLIFTYKMNYLSVQPRTWTLMYTYICTYKCFVFPQVQPNCNIWICALWGGERIAITQVSVRKHTKRVLVVKFACARCCWPVPTQYNLLLDADMPRHG